jgi:hypothetical protein
MRYFTILWLITSLFSFVEGVEGYKIYDAWFTGPLITPSGNNLEPGLCNYQPYLFYYDFEPTNPNDSHTKSVQTDNYVQFGLLDFLDMTIIFHLIYNHKNSINTFGYPDTDIVFGIQLLRQEENTPIPSLRLTIGETFPTGKYQNLDPNKSSLDDFGLGSFRTNLSFNMSKKVFWIKNHTLNFRLTNSVAIFPLVLVKNFNTYGGGYNTYGKVSPPLSYAGRFAFELSLTQRWAYAMDFEYIYTSKIKFSGNPGTNADGSPATVGGKSTQIFSIAPALEYSFNENLGIISGFYFSLYTKNKGDFFSYSFSFTYSF